MFAYVYSRKNICILQITYKFVHTCIHIYDMGNYLHNCVHFAVIAITNSIDQLKSIYVYVECVMIVN